MAESVATMGLRYATITGVARDDLPDGGAWLYAETIRQVHALNPGTGVEILIPDFNAIPEQVNQVIDAAPQVFAHNVETVPRIFKRIRPAFRYQRSLDVITMGRDAGLVTKSNLILGMGETREEVSEALRDLHEAGCDLITITQYLRPSPRHHPVERWVKPEEFVELSDEATEIGFAGVMAGPLVRSSYRAGRLWAQAMQRRGEQLPEALAHLARGRHRRRRRPPACWPAEHHAPLPRPTARELEELHDGPQHRRPAEPQEAALQAAAHDRHRLQPGPPARPCGRLVDARCVRAGRGRLRRPRDRVRAPGLPAGHRRCRWPCWPPAIVMVRRTERAAYGRLEGQVGGGGAALGALRRGWFHDEQPVAIEASRPGDMASAAMVFRAIGRPGVVLVRRGPARPRRRSSADKERKRVNRVLPNVPVTAGPDRHRRGRGAGAQAGQQAQPDAARAVQGRGASRSTSGCGPSGSTPLPVPKGIDPTAGPPRPQGHARPLTPAARRWPPQRFSRSSHVDTQP